MKSVLDSLIVNQQHMLTLRSARDLQIEQYYQGKVTEYDRGYADGLALAYSIFQDKEPNEIKVGKDVKTI